MTTLEAIEQRQSRRSYLGTPVDEVIVSRLQEAMYQYNRISDLSIQWIDNGQEAFQGFTIGYGMFSGVRSYFALIGKKNDSLLKEKLGYYGELLALEAVKSGLGTCWVAGTFNRNQCPCTLQEDETLVGLLVVGNIAAKKGFKENTIYKLTHRKTKPLEALYSGKGTVPGWFLNGMRAVQKAPSAVNLQPVYFTYSGGIVTAQIRNPESYQAIDLGIAKLHFEIGAGNGRFKFGNGQEFEINGSKPL